MSKGKIPINAARKIAEQYDCPIVIVYGLSANGEQFHLTTYGKNKALCRHAADIGRQFAEAVLNEKVAPADVEPTHLPDVPAQFVRQTGIGM